MARELIAEVPLQHVRTIDIAGNVGSHELFHDAFMSARSVTKLCLSDAEASRYLPALIPIPSELDTSTTSTGGDSHASHAILFPSLLELVCLSVLFEERCYHAGELIKVQSALDLALKGRSRVLGKNLHRLTVESCDVLVKWIRGWEEFVDNMYWDGYRGDLIGSEDEDEDHEEDGLGEDEDEDPHWG